MKKLLLFVSVLLFSQNLFSQVTLLTPNGGEVWLAGSTQTVSWTDVNPTGYVNLDYSSDNGGTWNRIVSSANSMNPTYQWWTPTFAATTYKVKVTDVNNFLNFDESNAPFTITDKLPSTLTLTYPNGGEIIYSGSQQNITWISSNIGSVNLYFSPDNGLTWNSIATNLPAYMESYSSIVTSGSTNNAIIKISDASDVATFDESNGVFTILDTTKHKITLSLPNGGENWQVGSNQYIAWTNTNITGNVNIDYSTDNGTTWLSVAADLSSMYPTFIWTVPNTPSTSCKIKVYDASDASVFDESDAVFTIQRLEQFTEQTYISLLGLGLSSVAWGDYNNDGYLDILLTGRNDASHPYTIIYKNNGDGTFTEQTNATLTSTSSGSAALGDYDNDGYLDILLTGYTISGPVSQIYKNNGDGTFTLLSSVSLPGVGNSSVAWGDYDNDGKLDILLTGNSFGARISKIYKNNGNGTFTEQTSVSLTGVSNSSVAWGDYDNDGNLDILLTGLSDVSGQVSIIYRNNGDGTFTEQTSVFLAGVEQGSVAWGDYDNDGYLDILLTGINGTNQISKIYKNTGAGTFTEQTSASLTGVSNSSVAWGDYNNDGLLDILLTGYEINNNPISKIYKNTGEGIFYEQTSASLIGVGNSSAVWGDYDNDGALDILLTGYSTGSGYVSKIYKNINAVFNTASTAPTNLTSSVSGSDVSFSWNKSFDQETPQNGLSYNLLIGTTLESVDVLSPMANKSNGFRRIVKLGNNQTNSWTIKNLPGGTYLWSVQAIDAAFTGSPFASQEVFTVGEITNTLLLLSPNGGENLVTGTVNTIHWSANYLTQVKLDYTTDYGATWMNIAGSMPAEYPDGYTWVVPNTPSTMCKVRVTDIYDPTMVDESDNVFTISGNTNISGIISTNTTWTLTGSPYIISGNVLVNNGVTLTIEPGVVVKFNRGFSLQVNGVLIARGMINNKITFTSNQISPMAGDWGRIYFIDSSTDASFDIDGNYTSGSILEYCDVFFGGASGTNGQIAIEIASPFLNYCTITNSETNGIDINQGGGKIINSTVSDNAYKGIYINNYPSGLLVNVEHNEINNNKQGGIYAYFYSSGTEKGTFSWNTISKNTGSGISIPSGNPDRLTISDNIIEANITFGNGGGIQTGNGGCTGGEILRNIIINNTAGGSGGGISIEPGWCRYSTTIIGNLLINNRATKGSALFVGTSSGNQVNASDNTIESNVIGGAEVIYWTGSGIDEFIRNTVTNKLEMSTTQITLYQTGIQSVNNNNFTYANNLYELSNGNSSSSASLNAKNNYWGTEVDFDIQSKIYDWFDDGTKGIVDYIPFLLSPDTSAPITSPTGVVKKVNGTGIQISWKANHEIDLSGYKIHYGSPTGYSFSNSINVGMNTSYTIEGLSIYDTIAVTAYDTQADMNNDQIDGHESWFTEAVESQSSIILNYPNGGEYFTSGTVDTIRWSAPSTTQVKIDYTTDNGATWMNIVGGIYSMYPVYVWTVPYTPSTTCKVRVTDNANPIDFDESDSAFTIQLFKSGEYIPDANTVLLDHFNGVTDATILAYTQTGQTCGSELPLATPSFYYNPGMNELYQALTLNPPIEAVQGSATYLKYPGGQLLSQSNGTIEFWIRLSSYGKGLSFVNQGQYFGACAGWTFNLDMDSTGMLNSSAWAAFSLNSGTSKVPLGRWTHLAVSWGNMGAKMYIDGNLVGSDVNTGMPANDYNGSVLVTLGTGAGLSASIDELRISNIQRTEFNIIPQQFLTVVTPNGGENFVAGNVDTIRWTSSSAAILNIEYSTDNGVNWISIYPAMPASVGSAPWLVPNTPSTTCKVKITDADNATIFDESDGTFSIENALQGGLVVYYPFNGNANDESGNGNHGINNGATLTMDRFGNANGAFSFNGVNNYIDCGKNSLLDLTGSMTICSWIKLNEAPTPNIAMSIIAKTEQSGYDLDINKEGNIIGDFFIEGSFRTVGMSTSNFQLGKWYFVLAKYNGNRIEFYLDAIKKDTLNITGNITVTDVPLLIGADPMPTTPFYDQPFKGFIDDCRIYNRALTQAEIDSLYSEGGYNSIAYGGKIYHTVKIGAQTWLKENLDIGTMIPGTQDQTNNSLIEKYCYNNLPANCDTYGAMYQWSEAMQYSTVPGTQGICPGGWHVASDGEWKELEMQLGMTQTLADATGWRGTNEGSKLKATSGWNSEGNGTDEFGFTALPGGYRYYYNQTFFDLGNKGDWWSATGYDAAESWARRLTNVNGDVYRYHFNKGNGNYIRCIKDENITSSIQISSPNGGEVFQANSLVPIEWSASNVFNFSLEFTSNNGASWSLICDTLTSASTGFLWKTPYIESDMVRVRISDKNNSTLFDESDSNFTVTNKVTQFIPLYYSGWNMTSFYVQPLSSLPRDVFPSPPVLQVKTELQSFDPSLPEFLNTLKSVDAAQGYLVKVDAAESYFEVTGLPFYPAHGLSYRAGWNLMSYYYSYGESVWYAFEPIITSVEEIKTLTSYFNPLGSPETNTLYTLEPGEAYWLRLKNNIDSYVLPSPGTILPKKHQTIGQKLMADLPWKLKGYTQSTVAIFTVTSNGEPVNAGSVVAAFVNNECRAISEVKLNSEGTAFATLVINGDKEEEVSFKIFDAVKKEAFGSNLKMKTKPGTTIPGIQELPFTFVTGVEDPILPTTTTLMNAYPNPFNPETRIRYELNKDQHVSLKIYDVLGKEVITLVDDTKNAGYYEVSFDASGLPSGIYFYRMQSGEYVSVKKLLLLK